MPDRRPARGPAPRRGRDGRGSEGAYYAFSYLRFAVPYELALAAHVATYPLLLAITAALALATAALVTRNAAREA